MELKPSYKRTEVGVIPKDWHLECVGNAFEVCNNLRLPISRSARKDMVGDYPYYGPTSVQGWINEFRVEGEYALIGEDGDHFLKWRSQPMTLLVRGKFNVNNHAHLVRGTSNLTAWFYWYFCNRDITASLTRQGASRYKLNKATLLKLPCPLPPLVEQRAIAIALSDIDALIAGLERLIAKKRDIKLAAMQQLLTGQTRLPGFSGEWESVQLGDVLVRLSNGAVYRPGSKNDVPITRIETIANGAIDYARLGFAVWDEGLAQYALMPGDILFSHINSVDHIGKVAIVPKDEQPLYHGMNLLLIRAAPNCNSKFLFFWLRSEATRRHMRVLAKQAVSQASINSSELRVVRLTMPPRDEQDEIANALSDIDTDLAALESRLAKTRAIKQGMMQELLTGRTRLV